MTWYRSGKWISIGVAIIIGMMVAGTYWVNRPQEKPAMVRNGDGQNGTVLVVYHPGWGHFTESIVDSLSQGLVERDWKVRIDTLHQQTPTEVNAFDVVVIVVPTYWWTPAKTVKQYLAPLALDNQPVVAVITTQRRGKRAMAQLSDLITEKDGRLAATLIVNTSGDGRVFKTGRSPKEAALNQAYELGRQLSLR